MYQNKLIGLLQSFSRKEMTRFHELVCSPYFNKHRGVRQLVGILSRLHPNYNARNCDRSLLYLELFPGRAYDQSRLALLFTYTMRLANQFLVQEELGRRPEDKQVYLLRQLRQRAQNGLYLKTLKSTESGLETEEKRDKSYYRQRFVLASESDNYYRQLSRSFEHDDSIQHKQIHLDLYYISEKLSDACEMLMRSTILDVQYQTGLLESVLAELRANAKGYAGVPAVIVYFRIYEMYRNGTLGSYYTALEVVKAQQEYFAREEQYRLYAYLQNFCVAQINNNQFLYLRELFQLYKVLLANKLLFEEDNLSQWRYKNIVTVALRLGENDWVWSFLHQYKGHLRKEVAENAFGFNLAAYYYSIGRLNKVLELLLQVEYTDLRYSLGARSLLLRTYFDLEEHEAFYSLYKSFKQYIQRNKSIEESRRKGFNNLLRYSKKAMQLKAKLAYQPKEKTLRLLEKLQEDVIKEYYIINKPWLLRKIEEIMQPV